MPASASQAPTRRRIHTNRSTTETRKTRVEAIAYGVTELIPNVTWIAL